MVCARRVPPVHPTRARTLGGMLQLAGLLVLLGLLRVSGAGMPVEPCTPHSIPSAWYKPHARHVSGALAGTAETQRAIWAHQHPADCSKAQLYVATTWMGGIGGKLKVMSSVLADAITRGRVMLLDYDTHYNEFARGHPGTFCPFEGTMDTCYFVGLLCATPATLWGYFVGCPTARWQTSTGPSLSSLRQAGTSRPTSWT